MPIQLNPFRIIALPVYSDRDSIVLDSTEMHEGQPVDTVGFNDMNDGLGRRFIKHNSNRPAQESDSVIFGSGADDWFSLVDETPSSESTSTAAVEDSVASATGAQSIDAAVNLACHYTVTGDMTLAVTESLVVAEGAVMALAFHNTGDYTVTLSSDFDRRGWVPSVGNGQFSLASFRKTKHKGTSKWALVAGSEPNPASVETITAGSGDDFTPTVVGKKFIKVTLSAGLLNTSATATLPLSASEGDWVAITVHKPASAKPSYTINNHDDTALLSINAGHADALAKVIRARFLFNGTNWNLDDAWEQLAALNIS